MPTLLASPTSPFTRTVRVLAHERGKPLTLRFVSPLDDDPELLVHNPIGKVPTLVVGDLVLCDSRAICTWLDGGTRGPDDLWHEALAHGVMEAALTMVMEGRRAEGESSPGWVERQRVRILRLADALDGRLPGAGDSVGACALGCALAYVDFRLPALDWRTGRAQLAAWQAAQAARPSMQATSYGGIPEV